MPAGLTNPAVPPRHGDHDLDPVLQAIAAVRPIRPAAVLVPIVERDQPTVLLTQRTAHLKDHAGPTAPLLPPLSGLARDFPPAAPEPERPSLLASLWEAVKKNPGTAVFWGIVALCLAVKIFGK